MREWRGLRCLQRRPAAAELATLLGAAAPPPQWVLFLSQRRPAAAELATARGGHARHHHADPSQRRPAAAELATAPPRTAATSQPMSQRRPAAAELATGPRLCA